MKFDTHCNKILDLLSEGLFDKGDKKAPAPAEGDAPAPAEDAPAEGGVDLEDPSAEDVMDVDSSLEDSVLDKFKSDFRNGVLTFLKKNDSEIIETSYTNIGKSF